MHNSGGAQNLADIRSAEITERIKMRAVMQGVVLELMREDNLEEATPLKAAAAYEAATKHRRPPAAFGPLPGEP
jgi:hypothetical protein